MDIYNKIKIHITVNPESGNSRCVLEADKRFYETTKAVADLISILQKSATHEEAIISYIKSTNGKYTPEDIIHVIKNNIDPLLFFLPSEEKAFIYQKEILSPDRVDKFSDKLNFLFHKAILYSVIAIGGIFDLIFFLFSDRIIRFNDISIFIITGLVAFTLFSTFIHELGHASACKHFGVKHGGIGFALYLNFPLLYTDVTEAWKLNRKQRCIVNIAGIYFQLYLLIILIIICLFTKDGFTGYLILAMNLGFIMTLNPFFKFDGYWIASDLLDIPNLRKHSKELVNYGLKRLIGKRKEEKPSILKISSGKRAVLLLYSATVNLFMAFYFFYIIPKFILGFIKSCSYIMQLFDSYISQKEFPPVRLLFPFIIQCLFALLIIYLLINTIRSLFHKMQKKTGYALK